MNSFNTNNNTFSYTYNTTAPFTEPVKEKPSWSFTISLDTKDYSDPVRNGYTKGNSERLHCLKLGYLYIMWGKDES